MADTSMYPTFVDIGPLRWKITFDSQEILMASRMARSDRFGMTLPEETRIVVDPLRSASGLRETVLHEVLHAAIWTYGIETEDIKDDELLVSPLASAVLDVLRRNTALALALMEPDEEA